MDRFEFIASTEDTGSRIDSWLAAKLEQHSRSYFQKLIDNEKVLVNSGNVKSNYKIRAGDGINVEIPAPVKLELEPEEIKLDILYEDEDLIVINKPQGMVVHPAAGNYSGTLVNALLKHCGGQLSGINGVIRPGIVHRIDKDTSGVMVVAKNDVAHKSLSDQIRQHSVTRRYIALVQGNIREESGVIKAPIGRHPVERKKMDVNTRNGRYAVTHFKVLERFDEFTYIEARLETGRTHQIRVHMAFIKHPVAGDPVYGPKKQKFNLKGQALHARILGFMHPTRNVYMEFEAPAPDYFQKLLSCLKNNGKQEG